MDQQLALVILIDIVGISIAVWFIWTRLRSKLIEVEERKARRWKPDDAAKSEEE